MDTDTTTDWRGLAANLANAAHRLQLTAVNLTSDPSVPEAVRRSPAFLAIVRNAELVDAFLARWREAERLATVDLVVEPRTATDLVVVVSRSAAATAWLEQLVDGGGVRGWSREVADSTRWTFRSVDVGQLVAAAKADNLAVANREA